MDADEQDEREILYFFIRVCPRPIQEEYRQLRIVSNLLRLPSASAWRRWAGPATSTSATPTTCGRDYDVAAMQAHAHAVLDAAWRGGRALLRRRALLRPGRGVPGHAGCARARSPPEAVTVGSKWGYTYTAGWQVQADAHEVKEHSLAALRRQWPRARPTSAATCACTRSTRPRSKAACSTMRRCWPSWPR